MRAHCHHERGVGGVRRDMPVQTKFITSGAKKQGE